MKKLDLYIIRKFLGTFFLSITLIIVIVIIFDISEKIDDFIEKQAPLKSIIVDYYLNFIPYFINLFSPLFVFISVIFFTAKMASNTEIVSILASGVSFRRLLLPYMICATVLASLSFYLNNFLIPKANKGRLEFEDAYIKKNPYRNNAQNIHRQIAPDNFIYFESYNNFDHIGYRFSLEKFENNALRYKLISDFIKWDTTENQWQIHNYQVREIDGLNETITSGARLDTMLNFYPEEFNRRNNVVEAYDFFELNAEIEKEKFNGSEKVVLYEIEKYKRSAFPFATFVLTIIGVAISSRKVRGGIGLNIMFGFLIGFSYILFMQVSTTFALNGVAAPLLSVWIPNCCYGVLALLLYRNAPK